MLYHYFVVHSSVHSQLVTPQIVEHVHIWALYLYAHWCMLCAEHSSFFLALLNDVTIMFLVIEYVTNVRYWNITGTNRRLA